VPARIGEAAIGYFLGEGARRLSASGELRVVVIRDLCSVLERVAEERKWPLKRCAEGARHAVYALPPLASAVPPDHESIYARDEVDVLGLKLERPQDISEEPQHQREGMPLLLELLPKSFKGAALVWRGGYGVVAVTLAGRGARVTAGDRDLLATTFTRRNAAALGVAVEAREGSGLVKAAKAHERFGLLVGELHPSASDDAVLNDLRAGTSHLEAGGLLLWLGRTRQGRKIFEQLETSKHGRATALASRGPYTVWRVTA
jgi:hypothetical protein